MHTKLGRLLSKSLTTLEVMTHYLVVHTGRGVADFMMSVLLLCVCQVWGTVAWRSTPTSVGRSCCLVTLTWRMNRRSSSSLSLLSFSFFVFFFCCVFFFFVFTFFFPFLSSSYVVCSSSLSLLSLSFFVFFFCCVFFFFVFTFFFLFCLLLLLCVLLLLFLCLYFLFPFLSSSFSFVYSP